MPSKQKISEVALAQCFNELRAACRRPIDPSAIDAIRVRLQTRFEEVLDHPQGASRWADFGQKMRDNGRYLGSLADFYGHRADVEIVGIEELAEAFAQIRDACRVRVETAVSEPPFSSGCAPPTP